MLSTTERLRYDTTAAARQDSFLAGRMVLRGLASQLTGVPPAQVQLIAVCPDCGGAHGRPEVMGSSLHVSLSHGAGVVVAAASWDSTIGVDIEAPDERPERIEAIGELTGHPSIEHWSRVEAVLKADGRGLRVDPSRVSVEEVGGRLMGRVDDAPVRYDVSEVQLAEGVRVSVAIAA